MTFYVAWQAKAQNDESVPMIMPPTLKLNVMWWELDVICSYIPCGIIASSGPEANFYGMAYF